MLGLCFAIGFLMCSTGAWVIKACTSRKKSNSPTTSTENRFTNRGRRPEWRSRRLRTIDNETLRRLYGAEFGLPPLPQENESIAAVHYSSRDSVIEINNPTFENNESEKAETSSTETKFYECCSSPVPRYDTVVSINDEHSPSVSTLGSIQQRFVEGAGSSSSSTVSLQMSSVNSDNSAICVTGLTRIKPFPIVVTIHQPPRLISPNAEDPLTTNTSRTYTYIRPLVFQAPCTFGNKNCVFRMARRYSDSDESLAHTAPGFEYYLASRSSLDSISEARRLDGDGSDSPMMAVSGISSEVSMASTVVTIEENSTEDNLSQLNFRRDVSPVYI